VLDRNRIVQPPIAMRHSIGDRLSNRALGQVGQLNLLTRRKEDRGSVDPCRHKLDASLESRKQGTPETLDVGWLTSRCPPVLVNDQLRPSRFAKQEFTGAQEFTLRTHYTERSEEIGVRQRAVSLALAVGVKAQ